MKTFAVKREPGLTQSESHHRDVPEQRSASVLQGSLPLTHLGEEQEVASPRLGPPCRATVMTLSVNLNAAAPPPTPC